MEELSVWTFMLATGLAAAALVWVGSTTVSGVLSPLRRRMRSLGDADATGALHTAARDPAARIWQLLEPSKEGERSSMQLKLVRAGIRHPGALGALYAIKLGCAVMLPLAVLAVLSLAGVHLSLLSLVAVGLGGVLGGSLLPDFCLARAYASRREKLMEALPDALDLLVTCTEAGLGLNAALERVVEQLPSRAPDLARELGQVNAEIRAGIDRNAALKNLGDRTGLEEIHGLVSLISHSTRLGTGIAGTLRIYSDDFRDRRMQRAEELAATVSTKLIFPLLLCLFPSFFVVSIGPAIIGVIKALTEK